MIEDEVKNMDWDKLTRAQKDEIHKAMKSPNVQDAFLSDKGDPEYGVLDKVLKEQQMSKSSYDRERHIARKHWIFTNNRIKRLPYDCRKELIDMAKEDVRICIDGAGVSDPICQSMALEVQDMEAYLG